MDSYQQHSGQPYDDGPINYDAIVDRFLASDLANLRNTLSDDENRELFESTDLDRIIALVLKGLREIPRR